MTIEKPAYDGYAMRFRPDLVRADGSVPGVDEIHLHHVAMFSVPQYSDTLQFLATGEEKTIAEPRPPYGMLVRSTDVWMMNWMLHNLTARIESVWVVYEIDYVPREAAERRGVKPAVPIWLDVRRGTPREFYPVFNVQRGYGKLNPRTGKRECVYPRDRCAAFDPYGEGQPGNGRGWEHTITAEQAGTLIQTAGHVHPGGLRDELSVVRTIDGKERVRRIFTSEAKYFDPNGPVSWDMAMTETPENWRVQVKPGDRLRLNAVYDAERANTYENMGIMIVGVSPGDRSGVDPFERVRVRRPARRRRGGRRASRYVYRYRAIPLTGHVTHGHLPENNNYGGKLLRPLPSLSGPVTDQITIANFQNQPGDLSRANQEGIPLVKADRSLTFSNADSAAGILHSVTTCRPPCSGTTGISYPIADDDSQIAARHKGELGPLGGRADHGQAEAELEGRPPGRPDLHVLLPHPPLHAGRLQGRRLATVLRAAAMKGRVTDG